MRTAESFLGQYFVSRQKDDLKSKETLSRPVWVKPASAVIRRLPFARYRAMNWLGKESRLAFWASMPEESGGYVFHCELRDSIAREVCFTGLYEPQDTAVVRGLLGHGMTFVDVGANWGYYTLLASHLVGESGRVISFEPDPRLFPILDANVRANNLSRVTTLKLAASESDGWCSLAGFDETSGEHGLSRLVDSEQSGGVETFEVETRSVDAVLDGLGTGDVDLLKMDIEGAEELALRGMRSGLAQARYRRILLEVHPALLAERGRTVEDVTKVLDEAGYSAWWIDHSPRKNRTAAYSRSLNFKEFLLPASMANDDAWPHMLWLAPNQELAF